jgi:hypothetical protein
MDMPINQTGHHTASCEVSDLGAGARKFQYLGGAATTHNPSETNG